MHLWSNTRVAPTFEKVYSIAWVYGLHSHNYWSVCFHLLGFFVPLGCYRLPGWNRLIYLRLARLE
jgi:hypothetical protein